MAFSLFARGASLKLNGCSGKLLSQNAIRLSSSALQNASAFKVARSLQPIAANILDKSSVQPALMKMDYSTSKPMQTTGSTTLWIVEKLLSAALVAVVPLAIAFPSKPLDVVLAVSLVAHSYWGFEAMVKDYVRALIFGTVIPKLAHGVLVILMMLTLGGLFYLIFDDIGIAQTIRRLWTIKPKNQTN